MARKTVTIGGETYNYGHNDGDISPDQNPDLYDREMFEMMLAVDNRNGDAPDGAWIAMLEETAEHYGREHNKTVLGEEIFGNSAFHAYLTWCEDELKGGRVLHPWQEGYSG